MSMHDLAHKQDWDNADLSTPPAFARWLVELAAASRVGVSP